MPGGISNIQDIYALAPLQEGILFHHLLASEGDPYLALSRLLFPDRSHLERYLAAVQVVVDRHDILRTSFVWEGLSAPAQVVWRRAVLSVTGPASFLGDPEDKTLRLYVNRLNQQGGLLGRQIQLIVYDDGGDANRARTFATRLAEDDRVVAMVAVGAEHGHAQVLLDRQVVVELEGLERPRDPAPHAGVRRQAVDVGAEEADVAL